MSLSGVSREHLLLCGISSREGIVSLGLDQAIVAPAGGGRTKRKVCQRGRDSCVDLLGKVSEVGKSGTCFHCMTFFI